MLTLYPIITWSVIYPVSFGELRTIGGLWFRRECFRSVKKSHFIFISIHSAFSCSPSYLTTIILPCIIFLDNVHCLYLLSSLFIFYALFLFECIRFHLFYFIFTFNFSCHIFFLGLQQLFFVWELSLPRQLPRYILYCTDSIIHAVLYCTVLYCTVRTVSYVLYCT